MAFEILKLTDITTAEQEAGQVASKTMVGHAAALKGGATVISYPANRKVFKLENSGDYVQVLPSAELFNRPYDLHWYWTNVGAVRQKKCVRGEYDYQDPITPYERDGVWYIKIESPAMGAGLISDVGGIYYSGLQLADPEDAWPFPFETAIVGLDDNFYEWDTINNNLEKQTTEIQLTYNPGSTVQCYYYYWDDRLAKYESLADWPTKQRVVNPETGWWMVGTAQDKLFEFMEALYLEESYRSVDTTAIRDAIWAFFKEHHAPRKGRIELYFDRDNYRDEWRQFLYIWPKSLPSLDRTFKDLTIVQDPLNPGNKVLNFSMDLPNGSFGFLVWTTLIEDMSVAPYDSMTGIDFSMLGYDKSDRLIIMVSNDSFDNPDRDNAWRMYWTAVPDYYTTWENISIPWSQFWKIDNLVYDGDRLPVAWGVFGSVGSSISSDNAVPDQKFTLDGDIFYTHAQWTYQAGDYAGVGLANDWGAPIADQTEINFALKMEPAVSAIYLEIFQERVWNESRNTWDYFDPHVVWLYAGTHYTATTAWQRVSVNFSAFSPVINIAKEAYVINFQIVGISATGIMRFTDLKFGARERYSDVKEHLYGVYFSTINYTKSRPQKFLLDNIVIGPNIDNPYPWVPTLGLNYTSDGKQFWQGPAMGHYIAPFIPYSQSDTTVLNSWLSYISDSQDEFVNRYGGDKGPFLIGHGLYHLENMLNCWQEEIGDFSWRRIYRGKWEIGTYLFNEGLLDSTKKGHTLVYQGGGSPSYLPGICQPTNTSIDLDGSHFLENTSADFDVGTQDFVIQAVIKRDSLGYQVIASHADGDIGGPSKGWELYFDHNDELTFWMGDEDGNTAYQTVEGCNLTDTADFHHVYASVDRDLRIWLRLDYAWTSSISPAYPKSLTTTTNFTIGKRSYHDSGYFDGAIDLIRFQIGRAAGWYEMQRIWSWMSGSGVNSSYTEVSSGNAQAWLIRRLCQYYYFTGDSSAKTIIDIWFDWFKNVGTRLANGYYEMCYWYHDWGYNWDLYPYPEPNYRPDVNAGIGEALLYYFWKTGDSDAQTWIRRMLDVVNNSYDDDNGGWLIYQQHLAFAIGYIGSFLGKIINGDPAGGANVFPVTAADIETFEKLYTWYQTNPGDTSPTDDPKVPRILNEDLLPYEAWEKYTESEWNYYNAYSGTTESLTNSMFFALEWGRYSGDYTWFVRMKSFMFQLGDLNIDAEFTLEAQAYPSSSPWEGDIFFKEDAYRLYWDNGKFKGGFYSGSTWYGVESETLPAAFFYHVAVTYDGSTLKLWLNGRLQDSLAVAAIPDRNSNTLYIGGSANQFYGYLGDLKITGKALEQEEVVKSHMDWFAQEALNYIELLEVYIDGQLPVYFTSNHEIQVICSWDYHLVQSASFRTYEPEGFQGHGLSRDLQTYSITTDFSLALTDYWIDMLAATDIRRAEVQLKATWVGADATNPDEVVHVYRGHVLDWDVKDNVLILKCAENAGFTHRLPIRRYSYFCGHPFKKYKCSYAGNQIYCHKSKTHCDQLNNENNFGGFENQPRQMRSLV